MYLEVMQVFQICKLIRYKLTRYGPVVIVHEFLSLV